MSGAAGGPATTIEELLQGLAALAEDAPAESASRRQAAGDDAPRWRRDAKAS